jgi:hypothetical protein
MQGVIPHAMEPVYNEAPNQHAYHTMHFPGYLLTVRAEQQRLHSILFVRDAHKCNEKKLTPAPYYSGDTVRSSNACTPFSIC